MDNKILDQVKLICKTYDIWPSRSKGQNFLVNPVIIDEIISAAGLQPDDAVLEVGPGLGILTEQLVKRVKKVVSVELDGKIFGFLQAKFAEIGNLALVNQDILKFQPSVYGLEIGQYKIVANLPYNITSFFLKIFLSGKIRPVEMTMLLQKEVAERICAKPGKMSLLAISVQLYSEPLIIGQVGRNNFWPPPEVDSAIIKISKIKNQVEVDNFLEGIEEKFFWQVVKIGFSAKRKQLQHNLSAGLKIPAQDVKKWLNQANLDEKIRAEGLGTNDWIVLVKIINQAIG